MCRPEFRGCPSNNASVEYGDPNHPARRAAREYREELRQRLTTAAINSDRPAGPEGPGPVRGRVLGVRLAVLVDGTYTGAAHPGPDGSAAVGLRFARHLVSTAAAAETCRHRVADRTVGDVLAPATVVR